MGKVAVGYGVVIRLQAANLSSFSYEQKINVLDACRPTLGLSLSAKAKQRLLGNVTHTPVCQTPVCQIELVLWKQFSSTNQLYCWRCLFFITKMVQHCAQHNAEMTM